MGESYIGYTGKWVGSKQLDLLCAMVVREAGALPEGSEVRRGVEPLVRQINDRGYYYGYDCAIDLAKLLRTRDGLFATVKLLEQIIRKIDSFGAAFPDDYVLGLPYGPSFKKAAYEEIVVTPYVRDLAVKLHGILTEVLGNVTSPGETSASLQG